MDRYLGFGIIGNFANHLKQAKEADEFDNIGDDGKPRGLFPFYVPNSDTFLGRYCINNANIVVPNGINYNIQAEPEICLECDVVYKNSLVEAIVPKFFCAFNDASIRNISHAKKLSEKKNFSKASKGCGSYIPIDTFSVGGICDSYSITSFLICGNDVYQYGNNSRLINYTYFHQRLLDWIVAQLNTQEDFSVLENLHEIIKKAGFPDKMLIAVGATSYTDIGETRYLQDGDEISVVVYDHNKHSNSDIMELIRRGVNRIDSASVLRQKIIFSD